MLKSELCSELLFVSLQERVLPYHLGVKMC